MPTNIIIFDLRPLLQNKTSGVEIFTKNLAINLAKKHT